MEGYTLARERKVPKNTKRGVCMACGSTAPALHATPHWYSFSLHKAAAATTWQCRLGAQEVGREKLPQFLCTFLLEREAELNQAALESLDAEATLYIAHLRKLAVGVCSKQWQALTDCKDKRARSRPTSAAQHSTYDQQNPKRSKRIGETVEEQQSAAAIAALQQQLQEKDAALQQQLAQLKAEQEQQLQQQKAAYERELQQLRDQIERH